MKKNAPHRRHHDGVMECQQRDELRAQQQEPRPGAETIPHAGRRIGQAMVPGPGPGDGEGGEDGGDWDFDDATAAQENHEEVEFNHHFGLDDTATGDLEGIDDPPDLAESDDDLDEPPRNHSCIDSDSNTDDPP